jgi:hypothetical protein
MLSCDFIGYDWMGYILKLPEYERACVTTWVKWNGIYEFDEKRL